MAMLTFQRVCAIAARLRRSKAQIATEKPVRRLQRAADFTPAPPPLAPPDPLDAEVARLWAVYRAGVGTENVAGFLVQLGSEIRALDAEIVKLEAELARLQTQTRFVP